MSVPWLAEATRTILRPMLGTGEATENRTEQTTRRAAPRIAMLVYNNCTTDARVIKEAGSLAAAGCDVSVIAVLDRTTEPWERRDGFEIVRIDRNPIHYKLL